LNNQYLANSKSCSPSKYTVTNYNNASNDPKVDTEDLTLINKSSSSVSVLVEKLMDAD
jgi:hypothetical protein